MAKTRTIKNAFSGLLYGVFSHQKYQRLLVGTLARWLKEP